VFLALSNSNAIERDMFVRPTLGLARLLRVGMDDKMSIWISSVLRQSLWHRAWYLRDRIVGVEFVSFWKNVNGMDSGRFQTIGSIIFGEWIILVKSCSL
jgi:hypothetical protein